MGCRGRIISEPLRLIGLNAWGGTCWPALADWLPGCGAEILCLQEVIRTPGAAPDWLEYKDPNRRLDQRAHLFSDVSNLLPRQQGFFAPAARGPLKNGTTTVTTEHGLGLWVDHRMTVSGLSQEFLFGTYRANGWGPEPVPRALQLMRLTVPEENRSVAVVNLHGIREPSGKGDTAARTKQQDRLCAAIERFHDPDEPLIVTGDFNLLPGSGMFDALSEFGLEDLGARYGVTDTRTELYSKPNRFADYTLVNDLVDVVHFEVPAEPLLSDHRPMILDFRI